MENNSAGIGCLFGAIILGIMFPPLGIAMIVLFIIGMLCYGIYLAIKFIIWLFLLLFGVKWTPKELKRPEYWNERFEITHLTPISDRWGIVQWKMSITNPNHSTTLDITSNQYAQLKEGDTVWVRICRHPSGTKEYSFIGKDR